MELNSILTAIKKYKVIIIGIVVLLLLTGCSLDTTPIDSSSTGFFNQYLVYPFSMLIKKLAAIFQGSFGMAIIMITLALRLIIMPFTIKQQKSSQETQEKMKVIKPEMDEIQKKYKGKKDTEDQVKMQKELTALYEKHNFNPMQSLSGCLPLLIQMPILSALYFAIRRTPEIAEHTFLWFSLGETDLLLVILAVVIYYLQAKVSLIGLDEAQKKQMALMGLISPVMIGIISLNVPAALPVYWAVGGLFIIVQTFIIKKFIVKKTVTIEHE